jgi:hypothetical protein
MEDWNIGRLEKQKAGILEEWKDQETEDWKEKKGGIRKWVNFYAFYAMLQK